uniref:Uncharacterized protein n=1 Tax=Sphenodon punctatus TaxID=8508 RepID=A0A8D0L9J3_SPHPU
AEPIQLWNEQMLVVSPFYLDDFVWLFCCFLQCLLYRTDQAQDVKKIEKFHSQLMRLMVARESRSAAMETD